MNLKRNSINNRVNLIILLSIVVIGLSGCFQEEDFAPFYDTNPENPIASIASSKAIYLKEEELLKTLNKCIGKKGKYQILVSNYSDKSDMIYVSKRWIFKTTHYTDDNSFKFSVEGDGKIYAFKSTGVPYKTYTSDNFRYSSSYFSIDDGVFSNKNIHAELFRDLYEMDDALLTRITNKLKNNLSYENLIDIM